MRTYSRKKPQPQVIENVQALCRLCLGKSKEMTQIFNSETDDIFATLAMRIMMCLGLEVSREDKYPKRICCQCNSELDKFYNFKKSCATTYRKLKANLLDIKQTDKKIIYSKEHQHTKNSLHDSGKDELSNENEQPGMIVIVRENFEQQIRQPNEQTGTIVIARESVEPLIPEPNGETGIVVIACDDLETQVTENNEETGLMVIASEELVPQIAQDSETSIVVISGEELGSQIAEAQTTKLEYEKPKMTVDETVVNDISVEEVKQIMDVVQAQKDQKTETQQSYKAVDILPAYIVTALVENGVLERRGDLLEVVDQNNKTFKLETIYGSEIVMELVEEEPKVPTTPDTSTLKARRPKIFESAAQRNRCGECGARFASRGGLTRHARVHSGEKPFACRTCGRRFSQREVMRRHELLHADKLPFECAVCPKAYTQRGALEAHMRAHAPPHARSLALHRCAHCPKVFLYPSGLSRHVKQVHQGCHFSCGECPSTFRDQSSLQRHARAHLRRRLCS